MSSLKLSKEIKMHLKDAQKFHLDKRQDFSDIDDTYSAHETQNPEETLLNIPMQEEIREILYNLAYETAFYDVFKSTKNAETLFIIYGNCLSAIRSYYYDSFMNAPVTIGKLPEFFPDHHFADHESKCNYFSIYTGWQTSGEWESYRQFIGDRKLSKYHLDFIKRIEGLHKAIYRLVHFDTIIERSKVKGYYDLTEDDVYSHYVDDLVLYRHVNELKSK